MAEINTTVYKRQHVDLDEVQSIKRSITDPFLISSTSTSILKPSTSSQQEVKELMKSVFPPADAARYTEYFESYGICDLVTLRRVRRDELHVYGFPHKECEDVLHTLHDYIKGEGDPVEQICRKHISQYGYRRQEAVVKVFSSSKVEKLSLMGIMISPYLVMIKTYNDEQISTLGTQPFVVQFFYGERQDLHSCLAAHIFFHVNYPLEYCISAVYPYYHGPADDKTFITSFISLRANPANDLRRQVRNKRKIKHLFFLVEDSSSGQWYFRPEWVQEISMTSHSVMTLQCIQRDPISLVGTPVFDSQWRFVGCISKQIKLEAIPVYTSNKRVRSSDESDTGCIENFFRAKFEITFMNDIVKMS